MKKIIENLIILMILMQFCQVQTFADQYTYDSLGRVESVQYDDGTKAVFRYDKNGNIESVETEGTLQINEEDSNQDDGRKGKQNDSGNHSEDNSGNDSKEQTNTGKDSNGDVNTGKNGSGIINAGDEKKTEEKTDIVEVNTKTGRYRLTEKGTASFVAVRSSKSKTVKIPDTIKYKGKKYKVTVIEKEAFRNHKKLKKVTIGRNITTIRAKAFYGCKKLKKVVIKSTKLKKIEKGAFSKISKKAVFSIAKKKRKKYKTLLRKSGLRI